MKLKRFRCTDCNLQIVLENKPERCFCCSSTNIVREGWKQRHLRIRNSRTTKEMTK